MPLMKVREYARYRDCSHVSVLKAIKAGRLADSITRDPSGKPLIDQECADQEWPKGTKELFKTPPLEKTEAKDPLSEIKEVEVQQIAGDSQKSVFAAARTSREQYLAKLAELEYQQKSGQLVSAEEVKSKWVSIASNVRTKILGIPSKARQRIPELTHEAHAMLEKIIREALEELSDG
jgi:hypothetical protein